MDLSKSMEVFNPADVRGRIHIIGCGSVGSTLAELLARYGLTKFTLYDFDIVEPKNIVNQMFTARHVGKRKVDALKEMICDINPEAEPDIKIEPNGWNGQQLAGYVFLAVDNVEIRKKIVTANKYNPNVKAMFDFRTALYDAQHYAADWSVREHIDKFFESMNFSHEEAVAEVPVSACGVVLGVAPTVRVVCNFGVINFINFVTNGKIKKFILCCPFNLDMPDLIAAM